jgi:hypothetical protein
MGLLRLLLAGLPDARSSIISFRIGDPGKQRLDSRLVGQVENPKGE